MGEPAQHSIAQRSTAGCIARTRDSQLAELPALLSSHVDEGPLAGGAGGKVAGRGGVHVLRNPRLLLLPPCSQRPQHAQQGGFCSDFAAIQVALLPPVHKTAINCQTPAVLPHPRPLQRPHLAPPCRPPGCGGHSQCHASLQWVQQELKRHAGLAFKSAADASPTHPMPA
jgi:hypothetical protein